MSGEAERPFTGQRGTNGPGSQSPAGGGPQDAGLPGEVDQALRAVASEESPERAALLLALIAHRAMNELTKLARTEANRRRGQEDWGTWAGLANSARDAVLRAATCRKAAGELRQGPGTPA